jgi:plastocyanin
MNSISFGLHDQGEGGTEVSWTNQDGIDHTVMADDGSVNSGELAPGDSFKFTFSTPGTYEYHCSIHPEQMHAMIEVEE